jgi:WD40 repeat protein
MHLWSTESGQIVRSFTTAPRSGTRRAFFTPDGSKIISGTRDGAIRVWDVGSGAVLRELKGFVTSLEDLAIVGQGASVATVGDGGLLRVWSLATGQLESDFSRDAPAVFAVAADPAGTVLVSGGNDGAVTAFDVGRRARLWRQAAHDGMVYGIAVSPSSHIVATGGVDSRLQIWNATSGQRLRSIDTENGTVRSLGFDPTGSKIAAAGHWRTTLWDLADASVPPRSFGSAEGTNDAQISDGMRLLATCHNGLLRLWDLTADARSDHWAGHRGAVTSLVAGIADGTMFSAGADGVVSLWQMGRRERTFAVTPATRVSALALSANRRWLSSVGQPGTAAVWDPQSGARITTLAEIGTSRAITFADADRRLIAGEVDGTIKMWDWRDDTAHNPRTFTSTGGEVLALASHGTQLFIAHRERVVVIRDAISGRELRTLNASHSPFSLAVTPDGRLLAAGTWSGIVDIWEIASGRKLHTLQGPTALVTALDINAQGTMLALSSRDGSTRLWDIAGAQWLATIATGTSGAERVRFLPDSRHLAIGYEDGGVEIRNIEHFFRHAAGHAEYQLQLLRDAGETFPDAAAVLEWSRQVLSLTR